MADFLLSLFANAQPMPALATPPVYLRQGDAREIQLAGQNLDTATSLALPDAHGLTAELVPTKPGAAPKLKLAVAPDAALGDRELRVITPTGVTHPLTITVGQLPLIEEKNPNNAFDAAQPVALPATLGGRIETGGESDFYRFEAKSGEHLIFDCYAVRLGSPLEPVLTLHDAAGHELRHADEFHGGDPMLVFEVPAAGTYTLQVRDLRYRGGGDFGYRIDAGALPYVESITPMSAHAGQKVDLIPTGHNLAGVAKQTLDLTSAKPGAIPVRFKTALGLSNEIDFYVTQEPTPKIAATAPAILSVPAEISAVIARPDAENIHRFKVTQKQQVTIAITARRIGSPLDALVSLKTAKGDLIEQANGAAEAEARISRPLDPDEYSVAVRDLTFAGGPSYAYRLTLETGAAPPDFIVRVMPDAPRVPAGGSAKLWCEVARQNGFKGPVTLSIDGLPTGVSTGGPVTIDDITSGIFTLTAAADAPQGTYPLRIVATTSNGQVSRAAEPELNSRAVRQAYLTITAPAPIALDAIGPARPEQVAAHAKQIAELSAKLLAPNPAVDAAQADWEKQTAKRLAEQSASPWTVLEPQKMTSQAKATLEKTADGAILVTGVQPQRDTYTVVATTKLKGITAIRLEALTDDALPSKGPGRAPNGNFVLRSLGVTSAPADKPDAAAPVKFKAGSATFEQAGFSAASAVGVGTAGGWAIVPQTGKTQTALFVLAEPIGSDAGSVLTFTMEQPFGKLHTLGKFRLSVTNDPKAAATSDTAPPVPSEIAEILNTPADKRSADQSAKLADYYRSTVSPELTADRARLDLLRQTYGPAIEIDRLKSLLDRDTPQLDAERAAWEKTAVTDGWLPLDIQGTKSVNGATLTKSDDGSVVATGQLPSTDTYTLLTSTTLKRITAVRLEALSDDRLPASGPGRGDGGVFVLSELKLKLMPKQGSAVDATFASARADLEQDKFPASAAIDGKKDTGWAIPANTARPVSATFVLKSPIDVPENAGLGFTLDQLAPAPPHATLGRFRLWVTASPTPDASPSLPPSIVSILKTPADERTDAQKAVIATYYRSIAPSLDSIRRRIAELESKSEPHVLTAARNKPIVIPVPITRAPGFTGEVNVTLEGFSAGRDPATRLPMGITKNFRIDPLVLKPNESFGKLRINVNSNSEVGTRMVVIRAETKLGNDTWVQYSQAFPFTVTEK